MLSARAIGLGLGLCADALFADPASRWHPVAWFGTWAAWVEKRSYADSRLAGGIHAAAVLAPWVGAALAVEKLTSRYWLAQTLATAVTTWAVVGAGSLAREGELMAAHLDAGDLAGARGRLGNLCARDPSGLGEEQLCRAAVESMAENTADAAVASIFWGAVAGLGGLVAHRGVNTLDAMIGYRNPRYRRFGTVAARLDDAANWLPARITGALACLLAPTVGGDAGQAWQVMRRDATKHPSPNGGWCESAWAGALGVQLGGQNVYFGRSEDRPLLGAGPRPKTPELRRAAKLVGRVSAAAWVLALGGCYLCRRRLQSVPVSGRKARRPPLHAGM